MPQGQLRVYLGAAPGVGKTYKMLEEGQRRKERGTDVVIGYVETHGRKHTQDMIGDLEVVPRKDITYRGATFTEMDVPAVIARAPEVVLVDELAHTNVPGSAHAKRWQDVETLLDEVVRHAEQVELVDMTPEALRRRMAHGNIYRPEKVDAALGNYFRVGNLAALRELALLWVADKVDDGLHQYLVDHGITDAWETRE